MKMTVASPENIPTYLKPAELKKAGVSRIIF